MRLNSYKVRMKQTVEKQKNSVWVEGTLGGHFRLTFSEIRYRSRCNFLRLDLDPITKSLDLDLIYDSSVSIIFRSLGSFFSNAHDQLI